MSQISFKALIVFLLSASFYLYEYILQVAPSVMMEEMMHSFSVDAAGFGAISAFYFQAYAPMQLPAGLLFDCYGPRRTISIAICICALGTIFFAMTSSIFMASLGRFLTGFGSAFSFVGILVLVSRWFAPEYFALLAGLAQLMSSVGAILGEVTLAVVSESIGWRLSLIFLAVIGFFLALLVWNYVRDYPDDCDKKQTKSFNVFKEWRQLIFVCSKPQTWWVGLYAFCSWTPIAVFGALWVVPYLQRLYHVKALVAAQASTMIWVGVGIGSPLMGWLSDKIGNRRFPLALSITLGTVVSFGLIFLTNLPWLLTYILLFLFGFAASGQTLSFALVKENNKAEHVGTGSGFNNLMVLLGGAIFQPVFGYILRNLWSGEMHAGIPVYSVYSYKLALSILPACQVVGLLVVLFFIKETGSNR